MELIILATLVLQSRMLVLLCKEIEKLITNQRKGSSRHFTNRVHQDGILLLGVYRWLLSSSKLDSDSLRFLNIHRAQAATLTRHSHPTAVDEISQRIGHVRMRVNGINVVSQVRLFAGG